MSCEVYLDTKVGEVGLLKNSHFTQNPQAEVLSVMLEGRLVTNRQSAEQGAAQTNEWYLEDLGTSGFSARLLRP